MISLSTIFCIFVSSSLLFATEIYYGTSTKKHSSPINIVSSLGLDYTSFTGDVDTLSSMCSTKLLTNDARLISIQQNIHAILKLLFGDYHLSKHSLQEYEARRNTQLKILDKSDTDAIEIFNEKFIGYDDNRKCLIVTRVVRNDRQHSQSLKYYQVNTQLPYILIFYGKMVTKGIGLHFILRMFPRFVDSYLTNLQSQMPSILNLTDDVNSLVKKFIWEYCRFNCGKIEQPSVSIMKHLAKKLFFENLDAKIITLRQGQDGYLCVHIPGKPCTVYQDRVLSNFCYAKSHIKLLERCKLPIYPSFTFEYLFNEFYYCIYTYNPKKDNKIKTSDFRECKQEVIASFITTAIPLLNVPDGIVLRTFLAFPKQRLIDLLKSKNISGYNKAKRQDQDTKNISSPSEMISDEQLRVFMDHFAAHLYTDNNQVLHEKKDL